MRGKVMKDINYWKLCDNFTVVEAALLIIGEDPSDYLGIDKWPSDKYPPHYQAALSALANAINNRTLKAAIRHQARQEGYDDYIRFSDFDPPDVEESFRNDDEDGLVVVFNKFPDWTLTTVSRESLTRWFIKRDFKPSFFFDQEIETGAVPSYLDEMHPHYAPKLAAAIRAWEAVNADPMFGKKAKTAKQTIIDWLLSHAGEFKLLKENGGINMEAIKNQIAKVANWETDGGAPKTP